MAGAGGENESMEHSLVHFWALKRIDGTFIGTLLGIEKWAELRYAISSESRTRRRFM